MMVGPESDLERILGKWFDFLDRDSHKYKRIEHFR
jgi:hypothetical protein